MSWSSIIGAAIPAVASVASGFLGSQAANRAAGQQQAAADQAAGLTQAQIDLQRDMYGQNRADLAPWRQAGQNALAGLMANWGQNYTASPSYNWRMQEGMRAVDAGMSARGLRNSTARDRAAARFADGLASQDYEQWWNRGAGLAGIGQTATAQGVQAGQNYTGQAAQTANNLASIYGQAGNAQAAGTMGAANAWGQAVQNLGNIAAGYRW